MCECCGGGSRICYVVFESLQFSRLLKDHSDKKSIMKYFKRVLDNPLWSANKYLKIAINKFHPEYIDLLNIVLLLK